MSDSTEPLTAGQSKGDLYPEHAKLEAVQHLSQNVCEFLEWADSKGMFMSRFLRPDRDTIVQVNDRREELAARFLNIDRDKLEREKQQMLKAQRELNAKSAVK